MYFIIDYTDLPDTQELRAEIRPLHRAHIYQDGTDVKIVLSGPTTRLDGRPGTMLVVQADDLEQAQQFAKTDPYVSKGVVERVEVRSWNWVLGQPSSESKK